MRFARYVGVQLVAYAIDMGVFVALVQWGAALPVWANLASKACAGLFAFTVHRFFTFGIRSDEERGRQALRYFIVLAINAPLSSAMLALLSSVVTDIVVAKIVADVMTIAVTYFLTARVVFQRPLQGNAECEGPPVAK